jgi:hypothetical protein
MAVMLAMPFVGLFLSIYFGHLTTRRRTASLVFWPGLVSRALLAGMVLVTTPGPYVALMSAFNLISVLSGPAYASLIRANYGEPHRGELMGNARIVTTLGSAVFAYLAGVGLSLLPGGYRWIFPLGAIFGVAASFVFRRVRPRRGEETGHDAGRSFLDALRSLREDRRFLVFQLLLLLCAGPNKLAIPLEPIWFVDHLRIDYQEAGLILGTVYSVCSVLGYILWGRLTRGRDPLLLLLVVLALYALRYPILAVATVPGHVAFASVLAGLSDSGFELVMLFSLIRLSRGRNFALAYGLHSAFVGFRGLVGPFIGSWLYGTLGVSIETIFWGITVATAAGIVAFAAYTARLRKELAAGG